MNYQLLGRSGLRVSDFCLGDGQILRVLDRAAREGVMVNVHAEDEALIAHLTGGVGEVLILCLQKTEVAPIGCSVGWKYVQAEEDAVGDLE